MVENYKLAIITNSRGMTSHQRVVLRDTVKFLKDNTSGLILCVPCFTGVDLLEGVDPAIRGIGLSESCEVEVQPFQPGTAYSSITRWVIEQGCDQYLTFPNRYAQHIIKDRAWAVYNDLRKEGKFCTAVLPWVSETKR